MKISGVSLRDDVGRRSLSGSGSTGSGKSGVTQFCCPKCGAPFDTGPSFVGKKRRVGLFYCVI